MAYTVKLDVECADRRCTKRATVEVRNWRNAPIGKFCEKHGGEVSAEITRSEQRQTVAP